MQKYIFHFKIFFTVIVVFVASSSFATTGTISTPFKTKVCHDATCTTPTPGILNFKPTGVSSLVIDSVTGISGKIWGNELGWINMHPTGAGVTFANSTTGVLTGKAWSQVSGWINFAVTGQQVLIGPTNGEFSGWAWSGGPYGGWIKFDCTDVAKCVKTTWQAASSGGGGGGGGGVPLPDVCPNIVGVQTTVPAGYVIESGLCVQIIDVCPNIVGNQGSIPSGYSVDQNGSCVQIIDVCPNIPGNQSQLPGGYMFDQIGACIVSEIDYCPNIPGNQTTVPNGYSVNSRGDCVLPPLDVCPTTPGFQTLYSECPTAVEKDFCKNILGIQNSIPFGYYLSDAGCFPEELDVCKNISGNQSSVPDDNILDDRGDCVPTPLDLCANLDGYQSIVPKGFQAKDENCFFVATEKPADVVSNTTPVVGAPTSSHVVAFPFVPKPIQVPSENSILKKFVKNVDTALNTHATDTPYKVDVVSAIIAGLILLLGVWMILWIMRRVRP